MQSFQGLTEKQQALVSILSRQEGEAASSLLPFLSEKRAERLAAPLKSFLELSTEEREELFQQQFQSRQNLGTSELFQEIDPGWLVDALKEESPLILSSLFQSMPSSKVGRLLADLPREVRKTLKEMTKLSPLPEAQEYLLKLFLSRAPFGIPFGELSTDLKPLEKLSSDQFLRFFREIGLYEISLALTNLHKGATRAILHRLDIQDAKELKKRMKKGGESSTTILREAQMNLLSLDLEKIKKEELSLEVGLNVFSQIFLQEELPSAYRFVYKLSPHLGYLLKRYLDQMTTPRIPQKVRRTRERVLAILHESSSLG